ncbi:Cytochrome b5-like Heme/Steroid binding domain containing protein [Brugia malayi]|nr:Cytochrome b5-like Heme/Steroid binding domain containing protein [Brugia malayi]VIO99857.1 Cytochrome b5-like Heme/Steroid binding domain containing protein [Brugia malayi]
MQCCFACISWKKLFDTVIYSRNAVNAVNVINEKNESLMLSVPQTSQGKVSETRRLKVALASGRSLMDWIKLTSSRSIAAKIKRDVDHVELSKHASVGDCWILLGEKVYDVTDYLAFHPGGVEELMRVAGTDGTDLFNKMHAWVNYDTMLKTCFVGTFNGDRYKLPEPKTTNFTEETNSDIVNFETARVRAEVNSDGQLSVSCPKWDQLKDENVSLEFTENVLRLLLHFSSGKTEALQWTNISTAFFTEPFRVGINDKAIFLSYKMIDENISRQWTSGSYHYKPVLKYRSCVIFEMYDITHDTTSVVLQMASHCRLMIPIGHHVLLRICVNGSLIERPYTPVLVSEDGQFISFMIKFYKNGVFTSKLRSKKCGDLIEISDALGCFNVLPDYPGIVLMLAAGTGLTPMIRFMVKRLKNNKKATIILFNRKEMDIVSDDYFTKCEMPLSHPLLEIKHCLSEADEKWDGEKGIISKQILSKYIDEDVKKTGYRILICGPDPFISLATKLLRESGVSLKHIYIFQS